MENPNHAAWKDICREISATMAKMTAVKEGAGSDGNPLLSPLAYEAAILALISDNIDDLLSNPVKSMWEHECAEDTEFAIHNRDQRDDPGGRGALFPYPGVENGPDGACPHGHQRPRHQHHARRRKVSRCEK